MKKKTKFIVTLILLLPILSFSNPIIIYPVISEVYFDENNNWQIEIINYSNFGNDTILIESLSGIVKVIPFIADEFQFYVITSDSLLNPLSINKNYDFIKVHFQNYSVIDSVSLGDYPNSNIHNLQQGYSIARYRLNYDSDYSEQFYKCSSPTMGYWYEEINMKGYILGNIFDNNQLLTSGEIYFDDYSLTIHNDGIHGNVFSRTYETIKYNSQLLNVAYFTIEPSETLNHDIYFTSVSVNEIEKDNTVFSIFPNPARKDFKFYYKTEFILSDNLFIEIRNIQGKLIDKIKLEIAKESFVSYHNNKMKSGIYVCTLKTENNILRSVNLIVK